MAQNKKNVFPWFLLGGGIFLLLAGLVAVLLTRQVQSELTPTPAAVSEVQRVALQDAREAFDAGTAVFLDVRSADSYAASHIPGALSMPVNELPARISELDPGGWIIPY